MSSEGSPIRAGSVDPHRFRLACGRYATGIVIATVCDAAGEPHGMTVNSFTSVSLSPPLVLFCVDHRARILAHFRQCEYFGINVLNEFQRNAAEHFASSRRDRFHGIDWRHGQTGVPLLVRGLAFLECALRNRVAAGDHDVLIGEVLQARVEEGRPLLYFGSQYREVQP
jgi:flavin reductase (DIM6/NTAB) family NADH-FMN oxidoreductase RutF